FWNPGSGSFATVYYRASLGVCAFEWLFHRITEPVTNDGTPSIYWDRGINPLGGRRAYYSRPLILSGGPDQTPGVFLWHDDYVKDLTRITVHNFLWTENNATQLSPDEFDNNYGYYQLTSGRHIPVTSKTAALRDAGKDDISNQNRQATGGTGGS